MKRISDDIKSGNLKQIYLLYGEETYLRKQYRDMLKKAIVGDDDMNYSYYEGKDINVNALIDQAETMPFFADKRLIVIENSGFLKQGGEELSEYLKDIPESTYFVIVEAEADKRSKLFKICKDKGVAAEMLAQDDRSLKIWIAKKLNAANKKMTEKDAEALLDTVGVDMVNLSNEIEKLISYTGDREVVTASDIENICVKQISSHIFDMIEAIGNRQQQRALELYYELLSLKEPPFRILALIARQFNLLLQTKELMLNNASKNDIATKIKVNPYFVNKYTSQASKFDMSALKNALTACVQADEDIKTGIVSDRLSVELLIVEFSK